MATATIDEALEMLERTGPEFGGNLVLKGLCCAHLTLSLIHI